MHLVDDELDERPYILFDKKEGVAGLNHIPKILLAIHDKGVISFEYQPFNTEKPTNEVVHPYLLKEYKGRWYLIGLNDEKKEIQHYGLDRIKSRLVSNENKRKFEMLPDFDPVKYFSNVIGVSVRRGAEPEKIILKLAKSRAVHLDNAPLHTSQIPLSEDEETKTYSFCLIPNYELTNWILSYGAEIEVLEPLSLRKQISEMIIIAKNIYK
jgi:predicted DNA-binding transcriptional regulator YafY